MFFRACQIAVFVLQQRKNEDIIVQTQPFEFSKNKSKQTLCDNYIVLVSMCIFEVVQVCSQCHIMSYCYAILNRSCVADEYLYLFSTQIHIR